MQKRNVRKVENIFRIQNPNPRENYKPNFSLKTNLNAFFSSKTFINKMIEERYLIYPFKLN